MIYGEFIKDLFMIIEKIDLSTRKRKFHNVDDQLDREFFFSDPSLDLEPVRAENFQILHNLVRLYIDVILAQSSECLQRNFMEWLVPQIIEVSLIDIDRLDFIGKVEQSEARKTIKSLSFYIKAMLKVR